jgi:putative hydrolase of the HAD superfamily
VMEDIFHLDRYVEDIIISAEEGIIKPDPRIYQIALERLGADPETTLFIDDYPPNVEAAREMGMKAVHFVENKQAIQRIKSYLDGKGA